MTKSVSLAHNSWPLKPLATGPLLVVGAEKPTHRHGIHVQLPDGANGVIIGQQYFFDRPCGLLDCSGPAFAAGRLQHAQLPNRMFHWRQHLAWVVTCPVICQACSQEGPMSVSSNFKRIGMYKRFMARILTLVAVLDTPLMYGH